MTEERPGRGGWLDLDAQDPSDPSGRARATVRVGRANVANAMKFARAKAWNLAVAQEVLGAPERIYAGLRPESDTVWGWCYVGRPESVRSADNELRPLGSWRVFVVFVSPDRAVYEWRPESADRHDPGAPMDARTRFGRLLWKRP